MKEQKKERWGFHGDVIFVESELPKGAKIAKTNILQGSTTPGHEHVIEKGKFEVKKLNEKLFLIAKTPVVVGMRQAKEKHRDVTVPKGIWEVKRALEADHIAGVVRAVTD